MFFYFQVCGVDGVMFQSFCYVFFYNSYVDYFGQCDDVYLLNDNFFKNNLFGGYFNVCCKIVIEFFRCFGVDC